MSQPDDQRRSSFIDQNTVGFVNQSKIVTSLNWFFTALQCANVATNLVSTVILAGPFAESVAEKVEPHFFAGAVGDISGVVFSAFVGFHVLQDRSDSQAETDVDRAHLFGIAFGQIVVNRDDVTSLPG